MFFRNIFKKYDSWQTSYPIFVKCTTAGILASTADIIAQNANNKDEVINELKIGSFESLINLCTERKEAKLKYELETNANLVSFSEGLIEISFNENLDKDFIKNLSNKLYEWTSKRWIISLSKNQGQISKKEKNKIDEKKIFDDVKKSETYKKVIEAFPDAELINVELKED